ncbi:MAG: hypothetical protein ACKVS7_14735 [Gemmatimonadaceae bacterium]
MEHLLLSGRSVLRRVAVLLFSAAIVVQTGDTEALRELMPGAERRVTVGTSGVTSALEGATVWKKGAVVELAGRVIVPAGASLTIEAGVTVEAAAASEIVVERNARFDIQGSLYQPVVFTCVGELSSPGCWDGLTILGNAPINHGTPTSPSGGRGGSGGCLEARVDGVPYGGCNATDSSGTLRYARVQYAARGLRLLGVGSGTVMNNLQVHRSTGNGIEIRGGTARVANLALTTNAQFGFVYGGGWTGQAQYIVVQQDRTGYAGGLLGDNALASTNTVEAGPLSRPTIANLTIVTPVTEPTNPYAATTPVALRFRRGAGGTLHNVLVVEAGTVLDIDDAETCELAGGGVLVLRGTVLTLPSDPTDPDADPAPCDASGEAYVLRDATLITGAGAAQQLVSPIDVLLPDLRPRATSALATTVGVPPAATGILQSVGFLGAVAPSNVFGNDIPWYSGWTIGEVLPAPSLAPLTGVVAAAGRGGLTGVTLSIAPSDGSLTSGALGAFATSVPAGPVEVRITAGLPSDCGAPPPRSVVVRPTSGARVELVADCPADPASQLRSLALGAFHSCGLTDDGAAWCWGDNSNGQLGDGTLTTRLVPTAVSGGHTFETLSAGLLHTCGTTASGDGYCWGFNTYGQLGDGSTTSRSVPTLVGGNLDFATIDVAAFHSCAVTTAGAAYCWGRNADQQLGDGTTTQRETPTPVSGSRTYVGITAGYSHSCALATTGTAYCWGFNISGALGDGTITSRAVPTAVAGGRTFARLEAGTGYTCAIETTGAAVCWGANLAGQLGDGTSTTRLAPTNVSGARVFTSLAVAESHSCGVTPLGSTFCWGANSLGQLGDGSIATRRMPTEVVSAGIGAVVANGYAHTCLVRTDASARCWGSNSAGQLGDGSNTASVFPVPVSGALLFRLP